MNKNYLGQVLMIIPFMIISIFSKKEKNDGMNLGMALLLPLSPLLAVLFAFIVIGLISL